MHAEVVFTLHPRADSDLHTSAAEQIRIQGQNTKNVEKSEIDMKQGSRKGSQRHPPPWFETHCQVVNAEFRFIRHPRAGAEPQSSTKRQKLPQKRKIMRTEATGAHAEEHVERCEAKNCHRSALRISREPEVRAAWKPHSSGKPPEKVTDCRHQRSQCGA